MPPPADIIGLAGVDIVIEASGKFKTVDTLQPHLDNGAASVIVAAPVKDDAVLNVVIGCNDDLYSPTTYPIATAASCTTNSIAPVVKTLHEAIGIERGTLTTIHDVTNTQVIVDAPHKDLRRARSALNSLIPTTTGSATAVTMIVPELAGRLDGVAVRVPMLNASLTDLSVSMERKTSIDEVNDILRTAAKVHSLGARVRDKTTGLRRLCQRPAVGNCRCRVNDGGRWPVREGTRLVRQRIRLCTSTR